MGIGVSIFLIALGAILAFALNGDTQLAGFNLDTIGVILLIVGAVGLLLTLFVFSRHRRGGVTRERVIERDDDVVM